MSRDYHVRMDGSDNDIINGTENSKQGLEFDNLQTIDGVSVPATFESTPAVSPQRADQDVDFNVGEITETTFNIWRGVDFPTGTSQWAANLIITGIPAITGSAYSLKESLYTMKYYLDDRAGGINFNRFDFQFLTMLLKKGQDLFMEKAEFNVLNDLHEIQNDVTLDSEGKFNMLTLDNDIWDFERGLKAVKITGDQYYTRLRSIREWKMDEHVNRQRSIEETIYRVL